MPSASLNPRMLIANPLELRGGSLDAADLQTSHVFPMQYAIAIIRSTQDAELYH
jgi:hypothetical protein